MNKRIVETRGKIIGVLNEAKLPLAVLDLVLAEARGIVQAQLPSEIRAEEEAEKEEKDKRGEK